MDNKKELSEKQKFHKAVELCRAGKSCGDYVFKTSTNVSQVSDFINESLRQKHIGSAFKRDGKWVIELNAEKNRHPLQEPESRYTFRRAPDKK